jgi:hypothetical protein
MNYIIINFSEITFTINDLAIRNNLFEVIHL